MKIYNNKIWRENEENISIINNEKINEMKILMKK